MATGDPPSRRTALVQGALLAQPRTVAGAFCASRLGGDWGHAFGTLGAGVDFDAIIARAQPH
jgi:putative acyl-CoA dehydrogenase